jgi:hypothetical protein
MLLAPYERLVRLAQCDFYIRGGNVLQLLVFVHGPELQGRCVVLFGESDEYADMSTIRQFPVNGLFGLTRDQSVQFKPDHPNFAGRPSRG